MSTVHAKRKHHSPHPSGIVLLPAMVCGNVALYEITQPFSLEQCQFSARDNDRNNIFFVRSTENKKKTKPTTNGIRCHWLTVLLTRIPATPYKLRRFDRFSAMKCRRIQCIRNYISKYTYIWTNWPDIGMHSNFSDNLFDFVWIRALRCISTNTRQMIQNIILFVCFILSLPYEQSFNEKVHRQSKCSDCMPVHSTCHICHARYIRCAYGTFKSISRLDR